jgi:hypothetical protein
MLVDYTYYIDEYKGETMDQSEFDKWNLRAEDDINNNSISGIDNIESWEEEFVKKAICSQIEYYYLNGDSYNDLPSSSEAIGKYSRSGGGSSNGGSTPALSPRCRQYLGNTNVLNRSLC